MAMRNQALRQNYKIRNASVAFRKIYENLFNTEKFRIHDLFNDIRRQWQERYNLTGIEDV